MFTYFSCFRLNRNLIFVFWILFGGIIIVGGSKPQTHRSSFESVFIFPIFFETFFFTLFQVAVCQGTYFDKSLNCWLEMGLNVASRSYVADPYWIEILLLVFIVFIHLNAFLKNAVEVSLLYKPCKSSALMEELYLFHICIRKSKTVPSMPMTLIHYWWIMIEIIFFYFSILPLSFPLSVRYSWNGEN